MGAMGVLRVLACAICAGRAIAAWRRATFNPLVQGSTPGAPPGGLHVSVRPIFTFGSDIQVCGLATAAAAISCAFRIRLMTFCVRDGFSGRAAAVCARCPGAVGGARGIAVAGRSCSLVLASGSGRRRWPVNGAATASSWLIPRLRPASRPHASASAAGPPSEPSGRDAAFGPFPMIASGFFDPVIGEQARRRDHRSRPRLQKAHVALPR